MLKFNLVSKSYGRIHAVEDISFEIETGEFVFLTGPSGAGKTTILKLILGEVKPDKGSIYLGNQDITKLVGSEVALMRQQLGMIFQDYKVLNDKTVRENIEIALAVIHVPEKDWAERVSEVLKVTGLQDRRNSFPSQLSGGELQRVSLARALVVNPKLILADEPTGNLDWETAKQIMDLLEKINSEGKTVVVSTHNIQLVDKMNKRIISIRDGKIEKDSKVLAKEIKK